MMICLNFNCKKLTSCCVCSCHTHEGLAINGCFAHGDCTLCSNEFLCNNGDLVPTFYDDPDFDEKEEAGS